MNGRCVSCGRSAVRNVVDVEFRTTVTAHYAEQYVCSMKNGAILSGEFPEGVNSSIQYGDGIRALVIALNTFGMMGINRVHEILTAVLWSTVMRRVPAWKTQTIGCIPPAMPFSPASHFSLSTAMRE